MLYNNSNTDYLSAQRFSNAAKIHLDNVKDQILCRDDYLLETCRNKKIIHLGFVDHIPLIDEKIKNNIWLHQNLTNVTNCCYGIDINEDGINYIQEKYNYNNLFALDIVNDAIPNEILDIDFDYLLVPDVIEHIGNPVHFLNTIRTKFGSNVDKIIITTPNAFRLQNFLNTFKNIEVINSDHRFWFTSYTLSKILFDAEFKIQKLNYFEHRKVEKKRVFRKLILSKFRAFRDTLIIEANLKQTNALNKN